MKTRVLFTSILVTTLSYSCASDNSQEKSAANSSEDGTRTAVLVFEESEDGESTSGSTVITLPQLSLEEGTDSSPEGETTPEGFSLASNIAATGEFLASGCAGGNVDHDVSALCHGVSLWTAIDGKKTMIAETGGALANKSCGSIKVDLNAMEIDRKYCLDVAVCGVPNGGTKVKLFALKKNADGDRMACFTAKAGMNLPLDLEPLRTSIKTTAAAE